MNDFEQKEYTFLKNILFQYDFEMEVLEDTEHYHRILIHCNSNHQLSIEEELKRAGCIKSPYQKGAYIKSLRWNMNPSLPKIGIVQSSNKIEMVQYEILVSESYQPTK